MKRGDILIAVLSGDYGKPRPAVLVQSEILFDTESLILCPLTSETGMAGPFRLLIQPSETNGLHESSAVMTEKLTAVPRRRCRERIMPDGTGASGARRQPHARPRSGRLNP